MPAAYAAAIPRGPKQWPGLMGAIMSESPIFRSSPLHVSALSVWRGAFGFLARGPDSGRRFSTTQPSGTRRRGAGSAEFTIHNRVILIVAG